MRLTRGQARALFFAWLPAAIGVLVICLESSDYLSAANTRDLLEHLWAWSGWATHPHFSADNHVLRKMGHFLGYGTLSLLFYRGRRLSGQILSIRRPRLADAAFSLLCTLVVASADEYHQSFLPSRTGRPQDVLLDSAGAALFLLLLQLWLRLRRRASSLSDA
ncbi:MAG: VanZ family protein [Acidobacteriaceae bacterium]